LLVDAYTRNVGFLVFGRVGSNGYPALRTAPVVFYGTVFFVSIGPKTCRKFVKKVATYTRTPSLSRVAYTASYCRPYWLRQLLLIIVREVGQWQCSCLPVSPYSYWRSLRGRVRAIIVTRCFFVTRVFRGTFSNRVLFERLVSYGK